MRRTLELSLGLHVIIRERTFLSRLRFLVEIREIVIFDSWEELTSWSQKPFRMN